MTSHPNIPPQAPVKNSIELFHYTIQLNFCSSFVIFCFSFKSIKRTRDSSDLIITASAVFHACKFTISHSYFHSDLRRARVVNQKTKASSSRKGLISCIQDVRFRHGVRSCGLRESAISHRQGHHRQHGVSIALSTNECVALRRLHHRHCQQFNW
jgi:hypothetical protein